MLQKSPYFLLVHPIAKVLKAAYNIVMSTVPTEGLGQCAQSKYMNFTSIVM